MTGFEPATPAELMTRNVLPMREQVTQLDQQNADLRARVLELEATIAARREVVHD